MGTLLGTSPEAISGLFSEAISEIGQYLEANASRGPKSAAGKIVARLQAVKGEALNGAGELVPVTPVEALQYAVERYVANPSVGTARAGFAAAGKVKEITRKVSESDDNDSGISKGSFKGSPFKPGCPTWVLKTRFRAAYSGLEMGTLKVKGGTVVKAS